MDLSRATWHKSAYSGASNCVEVAVLDGGVAVRDSKNQQGPVLLFTPREWEAFIAGVLDGDFRPKHRQAPGQQSRP